MNILRSIISWVMPLLILGGGVAVFMALGSQPPPPRREADAVPTAIVRAMPAVREAGIIDIDFDGVVVPLREVTLSAEVGGRVVHKAAACRGGQFVEAGTLLLEVDPRDYELEARRLEQELKQAVLTIEEIDEEIKQNAQSVELAKRQVELAHREVVRLDGLKSGREGGIRGVVVEADVERALRDELSADSNLNTLQGQTRVLAKRRIRLTEAQTLTATMLERARLDLERTKVTAPVSGMVVAEMVEQDSFVSKGTPLVTIEDTSAAEIRVSLQMDEVSRIWSDSRRVMNGSPYGFPSTPATVIYQIGERRYRWHGVLKRQEGKGIDERTRTLPCRVLVSDPTKVEALDRYGAALPDLPAGTPLSLLRGMFVDVSVSVKTDLSLVSTPCEALRPNGDVWVVRNNALSILRPPLVHVAAGRAVFESTRDGLQPDDRVIISQLSNVREGMAVAEVASERSPVKTAQAPEAAASPDVTPPQPRE